MRVTMIKKRLKDGRACDKCDKADELLSQRGLKGGIERVVWADEADPASEGMQLAARHDVSLAPFFLVERDGRTEVYTSVLRLINDVLAPRPAPTAASANAVDADALESELHGAAPLEIVRRALTSFGADCVIMFSGAEDVVLLDMARKSGQPFRVATLDTGRLHPETYRFLDRARAHFGVEIAAWFPDAVRVEQMVRKKGLFSFYEDGHEECCGIRKVGPLARALSEAGAWMTGQRRDQSPTRTMLRVVERDAARSGKAGPLIKWNPLAEWSLADVWAYIRDEGLPYNSLHDQGFVSIGCEPCTRAVRPGEHERAGRWWWEEATQRECGLHVKK